MPLESNKMSIAASGLADEIRIFYCGDGRIWMILCDSEEVVNNDYSKVPWSTAEVQVPANCAPAIGSSLSSIYSGSSGISLFYQTSDNTIRELRREPKKRDWSMSTTFAQSNVMPGTHIAEVHNRNADRVIIFFQDKDGYVCSRRAVNWVWEAAVLICQAQPATPIAATCWSDTNIRLYIQDGGLIKLYNGSFDGNWNLANFNLTTGNKKVDSMAAVSWPGPQTRLYMHADDGSVMELSSGPFSDGRGYNDSLVTLATTQPNVRISALSQLSNQDQLVYVYYASSAKSLQQRFGTAAVSAPTATARMNWSPEAAMADITTLMKPTTTIPPIPITVTPPSKSPINFAGTGLEYDPKDSAVQISPPSQLPMAISATSWPGSARVYTQKGDGLIRQAALGGFQLGHRLPPLDLYVAERYTPCALCSLEPHMFYFRKALNLCTSFSALTTSRRKWGMFAGDKLATIFYQTPDNVIHEMRIDAQAKWIVSNFTQSDAMPGTAIAAVRNKDADRFMIFFQDKDGFLCYRRAIKWVWDAAVRLCKAATNTPIAAAAWSDVSNMTWSDANHVRLYFQDTKNQLRELYATFDDNWSESWFVGNLKLSGLRSTGSIGVICWQGPHILIYAQAQDNSIHQISCGPNFNYVESIVDTGPSPVLPNTGVAAFATQFEARTLYGRVYWANSEKLLQEKDVADGVWHPATVIAM
ncbi:hypothetical protein MVEN_00145000 [Mycena venus]|uniref:Fucose-specific lectin n=1 Tax=Mycena venus TaxID=2733690 RepID=A0A8H6YZM7_9AGAR|nr:hypothetical protein MVEN_00145000 [Mycena venus]